MATRSASSQQAAQSAIGDLALRELRGFWASFDPKDLQGSVPRLKAVVWALSRKYGPMSGALGGRYFLSARQDAGLSGGSVSFADPPPDARIAKSVDWAVGTTKFDTPSGLTLLETKVEGIVDRLVQDEGRDTVIGSVRDDAKAIGWARIPEQGACYFCALLATRGGVYKDGSFDDSDARFLPHKDTPSSIKVHDHCRCHAEPVFTAYEPSAQVRQWKADYKAATKGAQGGGDNLMYAWRRSFEGRTDGPSRRTP